MNDYFFMNLVRKTHAVEDRRHEFHIRCPECGHYSTPRKPHCSFNHQGWKCFVCGSGGSLKQLADLVGLHSDGPYIAPIHIKQEVKTPPSWLSKAESFVAGYEAHPKRYELWHSYKPVSIETINRMRLGVGVLPKYSSQCQHERLIVPVFDGTMCLGLRGRSLGCNCGKWLSSSGTILELLPLYNAEALKSGCVVWIVENPVDALLITDNTPYIGVAVYSTSYWRDAWLETLRTAQPEMIIVALDNDLVGLGGANRRDEFIQDWLKTHKSVPEPRGIRLANLLLQQGLPAKIFDWGSAPYKADIGSLLMEAQNV